MDRFRTSGLTIAPGENEKPLSLFQTKNKEYKPFRSIYCGHPMKPMNYNNSNVEKLTYGEQVKFELLNEDRRCAEHVPIIFYKTKKYKYSKLTQQEILQ